MSLRRGLTVMFLAAALVIGGGYLGWKTLLQGEDPLSIEDACAAFYEGFIEYGTRAIGPPPEGWLEGQLEVCAQGKGVFRWRSNVSVNLTEVKDATYCGFWEYGQAKAIEQFKIYGHQSEPHGCPL